MFNPVNNTGAITASFCSEELQGRRKEGVRKEGGERVRREEGGRREDEDEEGGGGGGRREGGERMRLVE